MAPATSNTRRAPGAARSAALVSAGILFSRLTGLLRTAIFAHFFGSTDAADAFTATLRIPNILQNLFGEGALSASFIPVYASLLARGEEEESERTAGAVLAVLALVTAILVLVGVVLAPLWVELIAPGFHGPKRALTIELARILFPGAGLLVISAWCLGILNSHRRFFLSYSAPVVWNTAMIATLLGFGPRLALPRLAVVLAWGAVAGSALQVGVQWPAVRGFVPRLRLTLRGFSEHVRTVLHNVVPVLFSRGVLQVSAYVDTLLASLLPAGSVATFAYAQTLYLLPISLFGVAVSQSELPAMSGEMGDGAAVAQALRRRLDAGLRQIAFFVVPSAIAYFAIGNVIVAAVYHTGAFKHHDVVLVWGTLAGATVGLLSASLARLYSSAFYALRDTRRPLNYAAVRVTLATGLGIVAAFWLPGWLGLDKAWGVAGLTVAAGIGAWVEFLLLRRGVNRRIGPTGVPRRLLLKLVGAAVVAAAAARGLLWAMGGHGWSSLGPHHPWTVAVPVVGLYGAVYFAAAWLLRVPELAAAGRLLRR
ncbi:MAG: murein biosynthesis integral membrane protein MurJ [Terriglobales bacterium]